MTGSEDTSPEEAASSASAPAFTDFLQRLRQVVGPHLSDVGYGNLREEVSEWCADGRRTTNLALVYETPGGSSNQINVTYDHSSGVFHTLTDHGEMNATDWAEILDEVVAQVRAIPERRMARLQAQVEEWLGQGQSRGQMFVEVNRLLQSDFRGGSITYQELRDVIRYIVAKHSAAAGF